MIRRATIAAYEVDRAGGGGTTGHERAMVPTTRTFIAR